MRKETLKFLFLLLVAIGAGPATASIWSWSLTPSSNATADASINWSEGQSPSSVNDSARAMMTSIAQWRNDISAVNTSTGTSTAYALATSEGVNTTPSNGQMISFIAHANSGAAPTLQVDGGNTYPLWLTGATIPAGTLVAGSPYRVAFSVSNSAWLLEAGYGNTGTPLGGILWSTSPTAPSSNFVAPSGQCISTTTYATYWVQQGSPASGGCPGGQFAIIDMRGRVAAALDTLNLSAAGRLTSSANGCGTAMTTVGAVCAATESTTLQVTQIPSHYHDVFLNDPGHTHATPASGNGISPGGSPNLQVSGIGGATTSSATTGITVRDQSGGLGTANRVSVTGGGGAHTNVQPTIGLIPYLRIL